MFNSLAQSLCQPCPTPHTEGTKPGTRVTAPSSAALPAGGTPPVYIKLRGPALKTRAAPLVKPTQLSCNTLTAIPARPHTDTTAPRLGVLLRRLSHLVPRQGPAPQSGEDAARISIRAHSPVGTPSPQGRAAGTEHGCWGWCRAAGSTRPFRPTSLPTPALAAQPAGALHITQSGSSATS